MLEVAVIGAGSSGLVAARHLIHAGLRPTIFEAANTVGGAWTTSSSSINDVHHPASKMWNGMKTNLSKYTCRFSDWPWPTDANTFPSADEMHDYLNSYTEEFLTASTTFQLHSKVYNVEQCKATTQQDAKYKVEWTDLTTQTTHSKDFGGVIVASGFFHSPRWPSFLTKHHNMISSNSDEDNTYTDTNNNVGKSIKQPKLIHSSEYRTPQTFQDKNVAIIGSSFSALEIAADIAKSKTAARVVNILPSIPWVLPRWLPTIQPMLVKGGKDNDEQNDSENDSTSLTILPVDLVLYQRSECYPIESETVYLTPEDCRKRHEYLQTLAGQKQRNSTLGEPTNRDVPPFVAISDEYVDLVREDKIEIVNGRLTGVNKDDGTLQINGSGQETNVLNDIDYVICCTGYLPQLQSFLSSNIQSTLNYDQNDSFCPMTLAWDTLHPSLPNFSFCGMYRGPYMGIMELQARLAAGVMSGKLVLKEEQIQSALKTSETIRTSTPRSQFPHFDYPGCMDTLSQLCYPDGECPKFNLKVTEMIVPTFYQCDDELSLRCKAEIEEEIQCGQDGSRMPKLVLQSILGAWSFDRNIVHLQTRKMERVYGIVKFSKYGGKASDDVQDCTKENSVSYREDGIYELTPTQQFEVFREYEYDLKNDALEIYFVEAGKRAHLFLSLKFVPEEESSADNDDGHWVKATSDHLCIKDLYSATFRVKLKGLSASEIIIKYRVKGPAKDYESTTIMKPPSS